MIHTTKITIDYSICGDGNKVDPRECGICLRICDPAVFLLHETIGAEEENPFDPRKWRVTPLWTSLCTRCMKCSDACPENAIAIEPNPRENYRGRLNTGNDKE